MGTSCSKKVENNRRVLVLKGFVFGIPENKLNQAFIKACEIIDINKITTIIWDGDKCTYADKEKGISRTSSFTCILEMIHSKYEHIEFIFFKKFQKAHGVINGASINQDEYGNVLGPFYFLTNLNTTIINSNDNLSPYIPNSHFGVEFKDINKWYELGVKGYKYISDIIGLKKIDVIVIGEGGATKKELSMINNNKEIYPKLKIITISVER